MSGTKIYQAPQIRGTAIVELASTANFSEYSVFVFDGDRKASQSKGADNETFVGIAISTAFENGPRHVTVQTAGTTIMQLRPEDAAVSVGQVLYAGLDGCVSTTGTKVVGRCLEPVNKSATSVYAVIDRTAMAPSDRKVNDGIVWYRNMGCLTGLQLNTPNWNYNTTTFPDKITCAQTDTPEKKKMAAQLLDTIHLL